MVNKVFIDPEGVLTILVIGDQTAESIREMGEKLDFYTKELRGQGRRVLVLDNLLKMGRTTSDARREVARVAKALDADRAVMVGGGSRIMRYGTNLMLKAIGRSNLRYFSRVEPARAWLLASHTSKTPEAGDRQAMSIRVSGQVQGVWFRDTARRRAERLQLSGLARNEPDGTVYMEVEGEPDAVMEFLAWSHQGSEQAVVEAVDHKPIAVTGRNGFTTS
jgi:acylphosphatase